MDTPPSREDQVIARYERGARPRPVLVVAPEPEPIPRPPALDFAALAGLTPPDRKWAVRDWIGLDHVTLLVGQGGIGKSLLAQQIESALAIGRRFLGDVDRPLNVLGWHCEDDHDELWRRQLAISHWLRTPIAEFSPRLQLVPRLGHDNVLMATQFGVPVFTSVMKQLREQANDEGADLVVLDNVAQLFGGNENDRGHVTQFNNHLAGALRGKAVLLLAHPSRALGSEMSGSGAWENVARTRLLLSSKPPDAPGSDEEAPTDENVRYLSRRKANYSAKDYTQLHYEAGVLVPEEAEEPGGVVDGLRERQCERIVIDGLKKLRAQGLDATEGKSGGRFLPTLLVQYELSEGRRSNELSSAMRRLMMAGKIRRDVVGAYPNRSPKYGLVITE